MKNRHNHPASDVIPTAVTRPFVVESVVFLCGAVVMVMELVGSRLLAPYFGNSIFVWTSLIGVMLGFMALGSFLGGRLGDHHLSGGVLFWILLAASASIALIAFGEGIIIPWLAKGDALRIEAVASAIALFALPSTILGMVSPYCIRLRMHAISDSGATVGNLYAISTLGSIVGTFAAGFWLIAAIGSHAIIVWIAAVPALLALLFISPISPKRVGAACGVALMIGAAALFSHASLNSFDTQYDRYFIRRGTDKQSMRPVVGLTREVAGGAETIVYADNGEPLIEGYLAYYDVVIKLAPRIKNTLLIGGGAFAYPRHQLIEYPSSTTDVVEIDPALIGVARRDFFLKDDARMRIFTEDGRTFVNKATGPYDVVLLDAFKSKGSVPYQLTTKESMQRCYEILGSDGVLAMNLIASIDGPGSRFAQAEVATVRAVFPQVEVFAVTDPSKPALVQNISIIASKDKSADLLGAMKRVAPDFASNRLDFKVPDGTKLITDDYAPVDQYIAGM